MSGTTSKVPHFRCEFISSCIDVHQVSLSAPLIASLNDLGSRLSNLSCRSASASSPQAEVCLTVENIARTCVAMLSSLSSLSVSDERSPSLSSESSEVMGERFTAGLSDSLSMLVSELMGSISESAGPCSDESVSLELELGFALVSDSEPVFELVSDSELELVLSCAGCAPPCVCDMPY